MTPTEFVSFFADPKSKVGKLCVIFELIYTAGVILIAISINSINGSGKSSTSCSEWKFIDVQTSAGDMIQSYVCTELSNDDGSDPFFYKTAGIMIFLIYSTVQYIELLIFQSFKTEFYNYEGGGNNSKLIFNVLFYSNLIQTVFVVYFGLTLVYFADDAQSALLNSTGAVFLGETDDLILNLIVQGKLRKKNMTAEVEIDVYGIAVTCPTNFLNVSFKYHAAAIKQKSQDVALEILSTSNTVAVGVVKATTTLTEGSVKAGYTISENMKPHAQIVADNFKKASTVVIDTTKQTSIHMNEVVKNVLLNVASKSEESQYKSADI